MMFSSSNEINLVLSLSVYVCRWIISLVVFTEQIIVEMQRKYRKYGFN